MSKAEIMKRPVEHVGSYIKKHAWSSAIESLVILFFGIFLVVWPDVTILVIANVLGAIFIVNGVYQIINYFAVKGQNDFFNNSLLTGVISLLIGIAAIMIGEDIASVFRVVVGIWMTYEALSRMNTAIKLRSTGFKTWTYILIIALIMLALGIFVTFNNGAIIQLIGWMMIITGAIGIVGDIIFIQHVDSIINIVLNENKKQ